MSKGSAAAARKRAKNLERYEVTHLPLADIHPYNRNPRKNQQAVQKVAASLKEFGWRQPIVTDEQHVIIAGDTRYKAAKLLGMYSAPVHIARGWPEWKKRAYRIADNRVGEEAAWNEDQLALELRDLLGEGIDLTTSGFDTDELDRLLKVAERLDATDGSSDEAATVDQIDPITKPGDLWILGSHRLLCGDCRNTDLVARLMNGEKADLVNMDPPYGVDYETEALGGIEGDNKQQDDLLGILTPAFRAAAHFATDSAAFYIWHASATRREFEFALDAAGLEEKQYITWVKEHFVLGRADYQWQTEPCFYAQKRGSRVNFYGDRKQANVWRLSTTRADGQKEILIDNGLIISDGKGNKIYVARYTPRNKKPATLRINQGQSLVIYDNSGATDAWLVERDQDKYQHPNQKPISLAVRAIENSSIPGQIMLDLFGGGGFTLLGAEATGRTARVMEKEPKWCDVIVSRWSKMTGKEPRRA